MRGNTLGFKLYPVAEVGAAFEGLTISAFLFHTCPYFPQFQIGVLPFA